VTAGRGGPAGGGQKVGVSQRPRAAPPPSRAAPDIPRQSRQPAAAPPRKFSQLLRRQLKTHFLDPEGESQKATLVVVVVVVFVVVVVVMISLKISKAFLICSCRVQRNFAYTFVLTFPTDQPSQVFHLFLINE